MTSIRPLREAECIPLLVLLLRDNSLETCQAAAGSLQNLSRESAAKNQIITSEAIPHLTDLIFSGSVECQVTNETFNANRMIEQL